MHATLPHCHRSSMSLLPAGQTRSRADDRGEHRITLRVVQTPPPRLPEKTAASPAPLLLTTAEGKGDSKAVPSRGTLQAPTLFVDAMGTPTQRKLAVLHLRTPNPRDSSTLHQSCEQRVHMHSQQRYDLQERSVNADMASEVLFKCTRPGPGAPLADADGISQGALVSDEGCRNSVRGLGGQRSKKGPPLVIDYPSGPLALVGSSASPSSVKTNPSNPTSMGSASSSGRVRLSPTPPATPVEVAQGSATAKVAKPKASSSSQKAQPELVSSPLSLTRLGASGPLVSVSRCRSSGSQHGLSAFLSSASSISAGASSKLRRSRCESSAGSSYTDVRLSNSSRSLLGRRVHFLLGDPAQDGLAAADGPPASVKRSAEIKAPLPRYPADPAAVVLAPSDADQRLAFPTNSSSSSRLALSTLSEHSSVQSQLSRPTEGAETHPTLSSLPLDPSSPLLFRSGNASVLSLRLNRKEGRIEAVPAVARTKRFCSNGKSPAEVGGVLFHSAASTAAPTSLSLAPSGSLGTHGSAIYQPGQPLPKPALRQVSRYGKDERAASSRTDSTLLQKGKTQWRWWRPSAAAGASMTAAAPPTPRFSVSVTRQGFTDYLRGGLIYWLQRRVHKAEAPSTTSGKAPDAGWVAAEASTTPSLARAAGRRFGRVELVAKWSLLSAVALTSFFLIFVDIFDN
ncbi:hypothetical protein LSCM4_04780 [Leishmania orientalis]|uniref:Uncharacterized protein n=1 Tax=Leishmania orientalis TaxID=2249476 RepID=A0A836H2Z4_9TRYP|nr:hypothetical protein LSCM4_04780 [Leishmania orientalis]